jgi:hypothetical protein
MRRGAPLRRVTPLLSSSPLSRSAPLARISRLRTYAEFREYRAVVTAAERLARAVLRRRSGGLCEGCHREEATDYAHRVSRAQGGPWCPANALHLGRGCHRWSHAEPVAARSVGWLLCSTDDYLTFPALLPCIGWAYLTPDGDVVPVDRSAA